MTTRRPNQALSRPSGWSDILTEDPHLYMRLSLSLDSALSQGKAPLLADLPLWAMGTSINSLLSTIPMSPNFFSIWNQQSLTYDADESRFTEVNDDEEVAEFNQCEASLYKRSIEGLRNY